MAANRFQMDRRSFLKGAGAAGVVIGSGGLSAFLEACGSTSTSPIVGSKPVRGGTLTLAAVDSPINLDPQDTANYASAQVYNNIFSRLVDLDVNFNPLPALAHSWTQDDDVTWTFNLVDNAVFHNGQPFTANDVQYTFQRVTQHADAVYLSAFKSVEILSKYQIRLHLTGPLGPLFPTLAYASDIVNENAVTTMDPKLHPVGTGPFKFVEWVQNDHVTLQRWDKYFKSGLPYLDEVIFKSIADDSVRLTALQTGAVDWIQQVPTQQAAALQSSTQLKHSPKYAFLPDMIALNCKIPPFNDERVRQAVAWAIDRKEIASLVFYTEGVAATEAVSPPNPFYSGANPYAGAPDPAKAKSLLAAAGYPNGLTITYDGQSNVPTQVKIGEILQSQLAKAGITLQITNYSSADWISRLLGLKYQMNETYFALDIDPAWIYYPLCLSTSKQNFTGFGSPQTDALLQQVMFNSSETARKAAYDEVVNAIATAAPLIFIDTEDLQYWMNPNVSGPFPIPTLDLRCEDVWKK